MEHFIKVYNLLYRIGWPRLLSVPESRIRDEDFFRGVGKNKFVIKFHLANLIVWKSITIEVWLLDIQEGKLFYAVLALKCFLLSGNGHIFSLLLDKY
jgi:hypothetical protein